MYCILKARKDTIQVLVTLNKVEGGNNAGAEVVSSVIESLGDDCAVSGRMDFGPAFSGRVSAIGIAKLADDPRVKHVDPECDGPVLVELSPQQ